MVASPQNHHRQLKRQIGVFQATMLGLGSILGTGVFVSIGIAAGVAGEAVVIAIPLAAIVALCNGISSAQLAGNHPVSGGTYEYGYRWLKPSLGFTAGWMFLCAKSASAATAALGFAAYFRSLVTTAAPLPIIALALISVFVMTLIVLLGLRRSSLVNTTIVLIAVTSLCWLVIRGASSVTSENLRKAITMQQLASFSFLESVGLMFVAYTGYGRIATLGEEIREPRKNIPVAILTTLAVTATLYTCVAAVSLGAVGAENFSAATQSLGAPLQYVAESLQISGASLMIQIGAMTAMLGVLLNLILGLSRVVLAMGRRGDLPNVVTKISESGETPYIAVTVVGVVIASITAIGSLQLAWSFSAFTVLIYYSLTNLCALQLTAQERMSPRIFSWLGLCSCLFLAVWVERSIWVTGLIVLAVGLLWHLFSRNKLGPT